MAVQPETLKFGPQWIRKLSDCAFSSQRSSTRNPTDKLSAGLIGISSDMAGDDLRRMPSETADRSMDRLEGTEANWDSVCSASLGEEGKDPSLRSHRAPGSGPKATQGGGSSFYSYSYTSTEKDKLGKTLVDSSSWQKSTDQAVSDQNWRRLPQAINPPSDTSKWKQTHSPIPSTCDTTLPCISGLIPQSNSLWDQQKHLWSKSTPQQLHGLEPLDSVPNLGLGQNVSCSVPELEKSASLIEQAGFFESTESSGPFNSSGSRPTTYSSLEEERGLHRPDGADDPDEHMWLYEDPQGRTQGSFSDAQMNDWLLAGIYFTPNLRIRRKCDNTFSTLADYTRLFGRIPFIPGPRVSPIHGGITPQKSGTMENPSSSDHVDGVGTSGLQHSIGLSSTSQSAAPNISGSCGRIASVTTQQPNYSTDFQNNLISNVLSNQNENGRLATTIAGTSSMCVNSSLPVLQSRPQLNALSNALSGLNTNAEPDAQMLGNASNSVNGASAFMALASLLSMNPTLASLALSFSGQTSGGHNSDLAAAALSPGFLSALAQYLNVQPHSAGHQPTSPMQQLAETAQLAAQLAALAGAHSPDQTPMQPEQALALAQLVISQASNPQWATHSKKDGSTDSGHDPDTDTIDRRLDKSLNDDSAARAHSTAHLSGDDSRQDQKSHWPPLFSTNSATRSSPRFGDGRFPTKGGHEASQHNDSRDGQPRAPVGFPSRQQQSKTSSQAVGSRSSTGKPKHANGVVAESGQALEIRFTSPNSQSAWHGAGDTAEDNHGSEHLPERNRGTATQPHSTRVPPTTGQWAHKVKQTPVKSAAQATRTVAENGRSAACVTNTSPNAANKSIGSSANHNNRVTTNQSTGTTNSTRSPMKSTSNQSETKGGKSAASRPDQSSACSPTDSDRTAQEELERLTSWCQARLSSIPLKEKVDIPTVVELLATLDAPYEVERMVQTFMGESARTSLFVKDFLDRRRPFWQLHRERRDNENFTPVASQPASSANGSMPKSSEKKKRSSGQDNSTQTTHKQTSGTNNVNGTPGWTKVGHTQSGHAEHSQDNQWHHIKPKGSHNRKSKKDKVS